MTPFASLQRNGAPEPEDRQIALEHLAHAWHCAQDDGIESPAMSHAAIFAALAALVTDYGEDRVADFIATLPTRIRAGEYTLERTLQ